ncbi:hypothetical protein R1flu_028894 [Riccia fluitans]|uniref:Uncharacterized protein n=1 Tax=Riccia fluitans TaxID=41844 RepID=A0ABD1XQW0_9MARC
MEIVLAYHGAVLTTHAEHAEGRGLPGSSEILLCKEHGHFLKPYSESSFQSKRLGDGAALTPYRFVSNVKSTDATLLYPSTANFKICHSVATKRMKGLPRLLLGEVVLVGVIMDREVIEASLAR